MACCGDLAPCSPRRILWISSRTNSPACVVGAFPSRLSLLAFSIVPLSGIFALRHLLTSAERANPDDTRRLQAESSVSLQILRMAQAPWHRARNVRRSTWAHSGPCSLSFASSRDYPDCATGRARQGSRKRHAAIDDHLMPPQAGSATTLHFVAQLALRPSSPGEPVTSRGVAPRTVPRDGTRWASPRAWANATVAGSRAAGARRSQRIRASQQFVLSRGARTPGVK
jgi:hypothetical protein